MCLISFFTKENYDRTILKFPYVCCYTFFNDKNLAKVKFEIMETQQMNFLLGMGFLSWETWSMERRAVVWLMNMWIVEVLKQFVPRIEWRVVVSKEACIFISPLWFFIFCFKKIIVDENLSEYCTLIMLLRKTSVRCWNIKKFDMCWKLK